MLEHEVACFQEALEIARSQILPLNIVDAQPHTGLLDEVDVILVGGAGDYSVLDRSEFLPPFFQLFIEICERGIPTFASCFGFQAMCLALGGEIIKDLENTEVGTFQLCLTEAGIGDDIFGILPETFCAQLGHKDRAAVLPADAINLATFDIQASPGVGTVVDLANVTPGVVGNVPVTESITTGFTLNPSGMSGGSEGGADPTVGEFNLGVGVDADTTVTNIIATLADATFDSGVTGTAETIDGFPGISLVKDVPGL
ncbi:gamma-glutamyl-gamma-aminobutyrate hydrolase family protein, partial [candidate division KSB1 bacterium]|nr:gamma-glutamyl-gamma-aminobutyrate hydrolase family protein [candidate division KSB1 bacterium]